MGFKKDIKKAEAWLNPAEPEELWEARMRDEDMHPRDDFDDIWLTEYEEEAEGRFPEWADEPDRRLY